MTDDDDNERAFVSRKLGKDRGAAHSLSSLHVIVCLRRSIYAAVRSMLMTPVHIYTKTLRSGNLNHYILYFFFNFTVHFTGLLGESVRTLASVPAPNTRRGCCGQIVWCV